MATHDEWTVLKSEEEAVNEALRHLLRAAECLCDAANHAPDGAPVGHYVTASIVLRDTADLFAPPRTSWPEGGAAIFDIKTGKKMN